MADKAPNDPLLQPLAFRPRQAAQILNRSESWLAKKRCDGGGPGFIKCGPKSVFYTRSALETWLAAQKRCSSTSEYGR